MSNVTGGSSDTRPLDSQQARDFDLHNETSVLALLRAVHQSPLSPDVKNKLRDTVFAFRAEKNAVVTAELAKLFAAYDFPLCKTSADSGKSAKETDKNQSATVPTEEVATTVVEELKKENRFGGSRRKPQFTPQVVHASETKESKGISASEESAASDFVPQQVQEEVSESTVVTKDDVPIAPKPVSEMVAEVMQVSEEGVPVSEDAEKETAESARIESVEDQIVTEKVSESNAVNTAPDRIKEIKREVNALVGNPVNLIDVHNEIGREYMNALLDAMKKSVGGAPAEVASAMDRLEKSFTQVKETMGAHSRVVDTTMTKVADNTLVTETPKSSTETKEEEAVLGVQAVATEPESADQSSEVGSHALSQEKESINSAAPVASMAGIPSVAKEKQVQEMMVAQKREAATTEKQKKEAAIAANDPLMAPEVTAGLNQLLSEWSLFKHSGLFGTGPSGAEHPLYKKLAALPMTAVVAGRFEGVTPQIKRSISDYMNGWRYEEGILHEQAETFEQYLRRVIKHILDKRK